MATFAKEKGTRGMAQRGSDKEKGTRRGARAPFFVGGSRWRAEEGRKGEKKERVGVNGQRMIKME
ncbi:hypothetical protein KSZ_66030 [Dictyobacter formicarum]|uniref:Uncharacterized protein n=1 Tax=Dictyobacter formicarum TaxID=2778368 RepID=A0ABQ3VRU3_9CHLR|nr:hypothetical protein KSZ_66030 [Dictyobacter formicarum]